MADKGLPLRMDNVTCPCCGHSEFSVCARGYDYEYGTSPDKFTLVRCEACTVMFLNPRPAQSELGRIYPPEYEPYHFDKKGLTFTVRRWFEVRKARELAYTLPAGAKILDAGCGNATFLDCLKSIGAGKWELWGNDIDIHACKKISDAGYNIISGRLEEISLPDGFFDMIILKQVIEHLDNPNAVIAKTFMLLKSGGKLIVETPNIDSLDAWLFRKGFWGGYHLPRHWTIFNYKTLSKIGKDAGFEVKSIQYMLSPAFWVQSIHHFLQSYKLTSWITGFCTVRNPIPVFIACVCDLIQKIVLKKTSNMRITFVVPQTLED
ncbi:MAG: class I SAM-dependent methyltransferase [Chitinispirillia bacterium]|nr:class I SAM-dependent methyltransferase [Chitinispirillia bacterium]